ncbi:MAG TPA: aminotransferase class I/II-fold pyridoxal phosphate-dependent enzyme [Jatrophihabitans sp.]|jgi:aspartate aminotransferase|uniref:aminotransferase class I/II-fold pyridoxal phosphate-dependent enzyme n=1 Tax=Jatrophihabitans sp. TaxID=1932789 RepID=UPI002EE32177
MIEAPISRHLDVVGAASAGFVEFLMTSTWSKRREADDDICDFVVGNPHDMPLPAYVEVIQRASAPQDPSWFAYQLNEAAPRDAASQSLRERLGIAYESEDVFLTKGASSALVLALSTVLEPGEEVLFQSPPWFFYESMIAFARGVPVRVPVDRATFDLDLAAIAAAITPRTRAVIVNSPNNPTGRIYPPETVRRLAELLMAASQKYGRAIYLVSDEAYNRILFDGRRFASPTAHYPYSFLVYSYAKTLLTPGQRLGYLALAPSMPDRARMRRAVLVAQYNGFGMPDAVLQHALPELERLCIDLALLQRRRDLLVETLRGQGYEVHTPEGAFYLLARSPLADDSMFAEMLAAEDIFVLPGHVVELPGYFRMSLTASDAMVERSLPGFAAALATAGECSGVFGHDR